MNDNKFCIFCPEDCEIEGDHHHYPTQKFVSHPGKRIQKEVGGLD